jgi:uncharacterized protein involved in exopolysaccharide biosynthesis
LIVERSISSIFANSFSLLWRRQWILYLCLILTSAAAFGYYTLVGQRYEAYVLLRAGQGIKERSGTANVSFGEGVDLQSRMESLSRIAKIDHVMQEAVKNVGYERLFPKSESDSEEPAKENEETAGGIGREQAAIFSLRDRVIAKQEGRSDLLKITFRHKDPVIAASFLEELANALVAIHTADVQVPGAQEFFYQQMKRLEEEAVTAASNLENFSVNAQIYAVDEQRQLLLKRANELATQMSTTRGLIEDRKGQKQAIVEQLQVLKPVTHSRTVTRIVGTLGGQDPRRPAEAATRATQELEETPPLLLVKVYQDNMATLMKVSAELNGATELLNQLGTELENVNADLAALSSKEAEYGRLKRILTTASQAAAHYANRMLEEQINAEVAKKTQLSSLRVVQRPIAPTDPVFPQVPHLIILALVGGILLGLTIIVGPELARASMSHQSKSELMGGYDDPVSLFVARQRKDGYRDHQSA